MRNLINDFITLFVAIDPVGTAPLIIPLTIGLSAQERRSVIVRAVLIATLVLGGFALFGHMFLSAMGISFASFCIAGGLVLFLVGIRMIFDDSDASVKTGHAEKGRDIAVFPLALPYMAGPATMLAVMVATRQDKFDGAVLAAKVGVLFLTMLVTFIILINAVKINKWIGRTGSEVIGRVMGIFLAALAAESVVQGVLEVFVRRG